MKEPFPKGPQPRSGDVVTLADQYGRELQNFLVRRLWNREDARDLAQEVYLRLLRLGKTDIAANCPMYFFGVAENVVRDFKLRARQQLVTFDSQVVDAWDEQASSATPDSMADNLSLKQELQSAIKRLPPTLRTVLLLHKREGMSYAEIAESLSLSIHTVQKYVARALSLLRSQKRESHLTKKRGSS